MRAPRQLRSITGSTPGVVEKTGLMIRLRLQFQKIGRIRFTSHRDLVRIFQRCFAAGRLPVCYSRGFHPHPRISLGPPLRTGWEGYAEYMDIFLEENLTGIGVRMNPFLPEGLEVLQAVAVDEGVPKLAGDIRSACYTVEVAKDEVLRRREKIAARFSLEERAQAKRSDLYTDKGLVQALEKAIRECFAQRPSSSGEPALLDLAGLETDDSYIFDYCCTMLSCKSLAPDDLLAPVLGGLNEFEIPPRVARKAMYVERNGAFLSPINEGVVHQSS